MAINRSYFFLAFILVLISGNPAMDVLGKEFVYFGVFIVFMLFWWFKPLKLLRNDLLVFGVFTAVVLTHILSFGSPVAAASLGFLMKLAISMLAVRLVPHFSLTYVSVMYFLACLSLFFFIPVQFGIDLSAILSPLRVPISNTDIIHIGIHNFHVPEERGRNCGMFWEPGAFAGYLVLALFLLLRNGQNKDLLSKHGLVLLAALLTTKSTTGYFALMVLALLAVHNAGLANGKMVKLLVMPAMVIAVLGGAFVATNEVSFLGEKINGQIGAATVGNETSRINRFGNLLYDLQWISDKPVLGWSATPATRVSLDPEVADLVAKQGNGLSGFTIKFGLIGLLSFIGFFAHATFRTTGILAASLLGVIIVSMLLYGEQFLNFPVFLTLMFFTKQKSKSVPTPVLGMTFNPTFIVKSRKHS